MNETSATHGARARSATIAGTTGRILVASLLSGGGYYAAARLGLLLATAHPNVAPIWPAAAVGIAAVARFGPSVAPAVFLAVCWVTVGTGAPWTTAIGIGLGNTLEALIGGWICSRSRQERNGAPAGAPVVRPGEVLAAAVLGALVSAAVGMVGLRLGGRVDEAAPFTPFVAWATGNALGTLLFAPLLLSVGDRGGSLDHHRPSLPQASLEALVLCGVVAAGFAFLDVNVVVFAAFGALLLLAIRSGSFGAFAGSALLGIALAGVARLGRGIFGAEFAASRYAELQFTFGALGAVALFLPSLLGGPRPIVLALILTMGLATSAFTFVWIEKHRQDIDREHFDELVDEAVDSLDDRIRSYEQMLRGAAAHASLVERIDARSWRRYIADLESVTRFAGLVGIGLVEVVHEDDLRPFAAKMRTESPEFKIFMPMVALGSPPIPVSKTHYILTRVEPEPSNRALIGYDLGWEAKRRYAIERARDTGLATATAAIEFVNENNKRKGFLYVVPVYRRDSHPTTIAERRAACTGLVTAALLYQPLLDDVLASFSRQLHVTGWFSPNPTGPGDYLAADGMPSATFERRTAKSLGDSVIYLGWNRAPGFRSAEAAMASVLAGAVAALTLAALWVMLLTSSVGARAEALAEIQTRRLEEKTRELDEAREVAEAANRAKSEFLANISHEIRTPMASVLGYTDLLVQSGLSAESRDLIDTIRRNCHHLTTLLNDILDLSKIEAKKFSIERVVCSPAHIVADVVKLMRARADAKGIGLVVAFRGDLPASILTDPTRLHQILTNLVGNAVKFTERGGVGITCSMAAALPTQPILSIAVEDTGIGLRPDEIDRLFTPYSQAEPSTARRFGGTGLGLAISRQLARLLGGDIAVASQVGKGSIFTLTIAAVAPLEHDAGAPPDANRFDATARLGDSATSDAPTPPTPAEIVGPLTGVTILIADDGPDNLRLLRMILEKAGAKTATASNGLEAVEKLRSLGSAPHLVFMDVQMPEMDGFAATIEARRNGYDGAIVAITAHATADVRERCLAAGCDAYLAKPVNREDLIRIAGEFGRRPRPGSDSRAPGRG